MNFIFIAPNFPENYRHFCDRLHLNGVTVLGIGDASYDSLSETVRNALTEYYKVDSLEDYGQVYRAAAFFAFKHGRIDWIESNNEYWLELDARLRRDFNVTTGVMPDELAQMPDIFSDAMGNQMYVALLDTEDEVRDYVRFILDEQAEVVIPSLYK